MKKNINRTGGLIFSQRLLLTLVNKGLTREEAYKIVQINAMKARDKKPLKEIFLNDPVAKKHLSTKDIEEAFNINYYLRNISSIFKRIGLL